MALGKLDNYWNIYEKCPLEKKSLTFILSKLSNSSIGSSKNQGWWFELQWPTE